MQAGNCTDESADYHTSGGATMNDDLKHSVEPMHWRAIPLGANTIVTVVIQGEVVGTVTEVREEDTVNVFPQEGGTGYSVVKLAYQRV